MTEDSANRIQELFDRALDLPPAERQAFLDAACRGDAALRAEVESLLVHARTAMAEENENSFLQSPVVRRPAGTAGPPLPSPLPASDAAPRIGHYRLLRLLGEGGMGMVYEAEQDNPHRRVALKMIRRELTSPRLIQRFQREAQILSRLQHPGIAQIYEAGVAENGQLFFAMEFIRGVTLDEYARRNHLDLSARLTLFAAVCDAVQHTHERGIIHRDLKPGNILVDESGQPRVLDFGVAHVTEAGLGMTSERTKTGQLLGTLSYMSPEQTTADPAALDQRSDVYALGVILFELLANRLPYLVHHLPLFEAARLIQEQEPARLGTIDQRLRGDVDTIVARALAKDKGRRYQSAGELASDIRRYLNYQPIHARRTTPVERLARWGRRNPSLAAALAAVALLLVAIAAASVGLAVYFRNQELIQRDLADRNQKLAEANEAARETAEEAKQRAETTLVDMQTARGLLAGERGDPPLAMLWFAKAAEQAAHDPQRRTENRLRARNWIRHAFLPIRACALGDVPLTAAFQPNGDLLLLLALKKFFLWDWPRDTFLPWADGTYPANAACWSPDGATLAVGLPDGRVQIRSVPEGRVLQQLNYSGGSTALAFSPDGRYLALAREELRIWDIRAKRFLDAAWMHPQTVVALAFNRKGSCLVTACRDGKARVFAVLGDRQRPGPLFAPVPHVSRFIAAPAFIDDDRGLVTITGSSQLTCWDSEKGQSKRAELIATKAYDVRRVVATPRGDWFIAGGWSNAQLWKAGATIGSSLVLEHDGRVQDYAFSPDGRTLLTADWSQTARLWSLPDGRPIGYPLPHMGIVNRCALAWDNGCLATAQYDGLVRVWKRPAGSPATLGTTSFGTMRLRVSSDGLLATPGFWHEEPASYTRFGPKQLEVQEAKTGKAAGPAIALPGPLIDSCMCADNRTAAAVSVVERGGRLSLCDVASGRLLWPVRPLPGRPVSVAARPHSSQVAVLCKGGSVVVVDAAANRECFLVRLLPWQSTEERWQRLEYTANGASLVVLTDGENNALHVFEADTGRLRYPPIRPVIKGGPCRSFALSSDSRLLATVVTGTNAACVWDLSSGRPLSQPLLHPGDMYGLFHVSFSSDGRYLLTSHKDGQARLWDWRAGSLACPPLKHPDEVFAGWILPDGHHAVTACRGTSGSLHVWELTTGKPVAAPLRLATGVIEAHTGAYVSLSPDGGWAFANVPNLNSQTRLPLTDLLAEPDMPTEDLVLLSELASARRIDLGGESSLNSKEWLERWQRFRRRQPGFGCWPRTPGTRDGDKP